MRKKWFLLFALIAVATMFLTACDSTITPANPTSSSPTLSATVTNVPTGSVAVLVLDDFVDEANGNGENLSDLFKKAQAVLDKSTASPKNCVYTIDGQAATISRGASSSGDLPAPHGEIVFEELLSVTSRVGDNQQIGQPRDGSVEFGSEFSWMKTIVYFTNNKTKKTLALVGIDTSNYTTADLQSRLQQAVTLLSQRGFSNFVVNMSFVIMPCPTFTNPQQTYDQYKETMKELLKSDKSLQQLETDLNSLADSNGKLIDPADAALRMAFSPDLSRVRLRSYYSLETYIEPDFHQRYNQVLTSINGEKEDPLLIYFKSEQSSVFPVAAAGNSGLPYAYAPAAWNGVLSVSAPDYTFLSPPIKGPSTLKFNSGEVIAEGCTSFKKQEIPGTSFAAPKVSYLAALYLLQGGSISCSGNAGMANPALGYAEEDGNWKNMLIPMAAAQYCTVFPTPMPGFEPSCQ